MASVVEPNSVVPIVEAGYRFFYRYSPSETVLVRSEPRHPNGEPPSVTGAGP